MVLITANHAVFTNKKGGIFYKTMNFYMNSLVYTKKRHLSPVKLLTCTNMETNIIFRTNIIE